MSEGCVAQPKRSVEAAFFSAQKLFAIRNDTEKIPVHQSPTFTNNVYGKILFLFFTSIA